MTAFIAALAHIAGAHAVAECRRLRECSDRYEREGRPGLATFTWRRAVAALGAAHGAERVLEGLR